MWHMVGLDETKLRNELIDAGLIVEGSGEKTKLLERETGISGEKWIEWLYGYKVLPEDMRQILKDLIEKRRKLQPVTAGKLLAIFCNMRECEIERAIKGNTDALLCILFLCGKGIIDWEKTCKAIITTLSGKKT